MQIREFLSHVRGGTIQKAMPILSFPGTQAIGVNVRSLVGSASLQADCMKAIANRYDMLCSVSLMDLSVEAEAFGCNIRFSDDEVPTVIGRMLHDAAEVDALVVPPVGAARTGIYVDTLRQAKKVIQNRPLLAGMIGPFSLAGRLFDMSEIMVASLDDPELTETLLEKCTAFLIQYAQAFKDAGADGIVIAEPAAGLLSPSTNAECSVPYVKRIIDAVKGDDFAVVYHNCGPYTVRQIEDILTLEADIYHFGNAIDIKVMSEHIPDGVLFAGNLAPVDLFRQGTPELVRSETRALMDVLGQRSNFIVSSGCDIPAASPLANIDAFFEAVADYYQG